MRLLFWISGILLAGVGAWAARNDSSYDPIAYLDLARNVAVGNWHGLVNGMWSPGYPLLLSLVLRFLRPSTYWLFASEHLLNFLVFVGALAAFHVFWRELGWLRDFGTLSEREWDAFGYCLFLWAALNVIGVWTSGPDLLFCAFLLLASGLLLRARRTGSAAAFAALGAALGLGYLAKAPMFPIALLMLLVALVGVQPARRLAAKLALSAAVFAAIAAPWIVALHNKYGRWTFGDSAALNYAWYVDGVLPFQHWQGGPPGSGAPIHPTRKIFDHPEAFEYATPIAGTYPPGDDPSYWYQGVRAHFDLRGQLRALRIDLGVYARLLSPLALVAAGFLVLAALAMRDRTLGAVFGTAWPVWFIGAAGLGMFALVHVEARYLGGFLVLVPAGLLAGVQLRRPRRLALLAPLVMGLSLLALVVRARINDFGGRFPGADHPQWQVAMGMRRAGVAAGDRVALLGWEALWSPMSRVHIVADIPAPEAPLFWQLGDQRRTDLLRKLAATGARAIVAGPRALAGQAAASAAAKAGWEPLGNTGFEVYMLRR